MRSKYRLRAEKKTLAIDALLDPLELRLITLSPAEEGSGTQNKPGPLG